VKIKVAWIGKTKEPAIEALTREYLQRIARYAEVAGTALKDEAGVLSLASGTGKKNNNNNKARHKLVLLDSRGKQLSSEELAEFLEREQLNALPLLFAVGGSDGFSDEARRLAGFTLSLGKMTLPHELARVVLLEQLYRAFTILKNHPYHLGH
jgi:23S rRNA (pseudouridine1915-N3)-methyltransferase